MREAREERAALEEEKAAMEKAHTFQQNKILLDWEAGPPGHTLGQGLTYTSPLSQLNLSSCVPVTTQLIPLIHSEMLNLS